MGVHLVGAGRREAAAEQGIIRRAVQRCGRAAAAGVDHSTAAAAVERWVLRWARLINSKHCGEAAAQFCQRNGHASLTARRNVSAHTLTERVSERTKWKVNAIRNDSEDADGRRIPVCKQDF